MTINQEFFVGLFLGAALGAMAATLVAVEQLVDAKIADMDPGTHAASTL